MDPYKILGVDRQASPEQIRQAYLERAKKHHPDAGGDAVAFQQVGEAYRQLTNSPTSDNRATRSGDQTDIESRSDTRPARTSFWQLVFAPLPLQNETTTFILVSALDIFMTYIVLQFGGSEANPIARFFLDRWGFDGMIFFKMGMVAFVTVVAQVVARSNLRTARLLLQFGTLVVALVVGYGLLLLFWQR